MATIQINRLLETVVKKKASDLHLAVGKPPVLRLSGHMRELQTKVLEAADTMALLKAITSELGGKKRASDLHLAVGKPPVLRLSGHMRELQTKVLEAEDTMALMKAITPERIQQEGEGTGRGDSAS